jgi:hypothetical protein
MWNVASIVSVENLHEERDTDRRQLASWTELARLRRS